MSINDINLLRIVLYSAILLIHIFLVIYGAVIFKKNEKRKKLLKIAIVYIVSALCFLTAVSPVCLIGNIKINENNKEIIKSLSVEKINMEMFEASPTEDISDRKLFVHEDESAIVFCTVQPKGTYTRENDDFVYKISESVYSESYDNDFGTVVINPICYDRKYILFVESFYSSIVIPISQDYDLVLDFECDTDKEACNKLIYDLLSLISVKD